MIELNQCSCPLQWVHAAVLLQIGSVEHCHLHFIYQQRLTAEANNIALLFTLLLHHLHYIFFVLRLSPLVERASLFIENSAIFDCCFSSQFQELLLRSLAFKQAEPVKFFFQEASRS